MSLRARLALVTSLVLAVILAFGGFGLERLFQASLAREVDLSLKSVGELIARELAQEDPYASQRLDELWARRYGYRVVDKFVQLLDRDGKLDLRRSGKGQPLPTSDAALEAARQGKFWLETIKTDDIEVRMLTVPVIRRGSLRHLVQIGTPLNEMQQSVKTLRTVLLSAFPPLLLLAGLGAWWLAGRALAPVDRVTQTARRLTARSLDQRLTPLAVKDELGRLVDTLNEMIGRLEGSFEMTRRFSADASHELRTPLTVLRGELELALRSPRTAEDYREVLVSCLEEVGKLSQIVDDLLFLSRGEHTQPQVASVDLNEVATEVVASLMPLARDRGLYLRLNLDPEGAVALDGDEGQLRRMLRNLVENALFYTQQGGVQVSVGRQDRSALLEVQDTGVGIAAEHQSRVFSRFYRVDFARTRAPGSSGLGLSIVQQVAEAHGGRVRLESQVGKGSLFSVQLPLENSNAGLRKL